MITQPPDSEKILRRCALDLWFACEKAYWRAYYTPAVDTVTLRDLRQMLNDAQRVYMALRREQVQG